MKNGRGGKQKGTSDSGDELECDPDRIGEEDSINVFLSSAPSTQTHQEETRKDDENDIEEGKEEEEENGDNGATRVPAPASDQQPKLDNDFYEVEAIRRQRVCKGQLQYLIKWLGWPESANTWEPLENLQSCLDVIETFEQSLQSRKKQMRKKHKNEAIVHTQPKKKKQPSYDTLIMDNVTDVIIRVLDQRLASAPLSDDHFPQGDDNKGNENNIKKPKHGDVVENGWINVQINEREIEKEYDLKLTELTVHFQEGKDSEGSNQYLNGAKRRRKPSSVKRFKQESGPAGRVGPYRPDCSGFAGKNSFTCNNETQIDVLRKMSCSITKIIKPIGYSTSPHDIEDVSITFLALRSDGTEVVVDNKFLGANHPLLLINFYEQHLRYSFAS